MIIEPIVLSGLTAVIFISLMTAPLGCFVVWKRMAYFGDAISHSALLGVAIASSLHLPAQIGALLTSLGFAFLLVHTRKITFLANDTLLGILAHGSLSIGLIYYSFVEHQSHGDHNHQNHDGHGHELTELLFGSLDQVSWLEIGAIALGALLSLTLIICVWKKAILASINEELAKAEGIQTQLIEWLLIFLMALTVALCVHFVGVLLVTALLIIPPAGARLVAKNPDQMLGASIVISLLSGVMGVGLSEMIHAPMAPSIVFSSLLVFIGLLLISKLRPQT